MGIYNRVYLIIMDIFVEKLKAICASRGLFRGCTLYGGGKNPERPGLPFLPEEAEDRFQRLKQGGVSFIRLVIAWEALEYAGPGAYDESCLAYLRKILVAAAQTGLQVFLDPVQNSQSRWAAGEGFPPWAPEQEDKGREWLQERYLDCMRHCFRRLKNCAALIGWGASAEDFFGPFMLRFAARMREAREGIRFFVAEDPPPPGAPRPVTGGAPEQPESVCYYDPRDFPDYQGDLAISVSC
jgi:hypothetical protein